jgi:hypothetical protein
LTELELNRRVAAIEAQLVKVQKIEMALRDRPTVAAHPVLDDVLPAISYVLMLLGEIARHGERLNRLEFNSHQSEALARRRAEGTLPRKPHTGRPVGRPRKIKPDGVEAVLTA